MNDPENTFWVGYYGTTWSNDSSTPRVRLDLQEPTQIGLIIAAETPDWISSANLGNYYQVMTDQQTMGNGPILGTSLGAPIATSTSSSSGHNPVLEGIVEYLNKDVHSGGPTWGEVLAWNVTWSGNDNVTVAYANRAENQTGGETHIVLAFPTTQDATNYLNAYDKTGYKLTQTTSDWTKLYTNGDMYSRIAGHPPQTYEWWSSWAGSSQAGSSSPLFDINQWDNILYFTTTWSEAS